MELQREFPSFDYSRLDVADERFLRDSAGEIRDLAKQTADSIVRIGKRLSECKDRLPHGEFLPWLNAEFSWKERTARNYMDVHEMVKSANFADLPAFDVSALYMLAADSTPEPVRQVTAAVAATGTRVTNAIAKGVKQGLRLVNNPKLEENVISRSTSAIAKAAAKPEQPGTAGNIQQRVAKAVEEVIKEEMAPKFSDERLAQMKEIDARPPLTIQQCGWADEESFNTESDFGWVISEEFTELMAQSPAKVARSINKKGRAMMLEKVKSVSVWLSAVEKELESVINEK